MLILLELLSHLSKINVQFYDHSIFLCNDTLNEQLDQSEIIVLR